MPQFLIHFPVSVAGLKNDDVSDGASHCGDERLSSLVAAGGRWFLAWLVCVCNWGHCGIWVWGLADDGQCGVTLDK